VCEFSRIVCSGMKRNEECERFIYSKEVDAFPPEKGGGGRRKLRRQSLRERERESWLEGALVDA
jgi:hypothetical protein